MEEYRCIRYLIDRPKPKARFLLLFYGSLLTLLFTFLGPFVVSGDAKAEFSSASISSEEILSSPFAKFFKKQQYQKAFDALDELSKKYPGDPLIERYRALTLEGLDRRKEAIGIYQKLLSQNPVHVPTRMFLGRAYSHEKMGEAAAEQFRWVLAHGKEEAYRIWAGAALNRLRVGVKKPPKPKRWYLVGKGGMAYDSNPLLVPNDSSLSRPGAKKRGINYLMSWTAGYVPFLNKDSRVDIMYVGAETLHSPDVSRVNFHSHGFAVDGKKRHLFGARAVLFEGRYDFKSNFLRDDLFSISNRLYLSADASFVKRTRTHFYGRFNVLNFGPDGSDPSQTSRDGIRTGIGLTQYFYTADFKRYFFIKEELNLNEARGENFDRRGVLSRIGIHTPIDFLRKMDLDSSAGFDFGEYHDFTSLSSLELAQREDARWDMYTALTYHWTSRLATRTFYRFIKSNNANNYFDRDRHMAGGEVIFGF